MPGDDGLDAFGHIAYTVNQFDGNLLFWGEFDRSLLAKGAEVAVKRYPGGRGIWSHSRRYARWSLRIGRPRAGFGPR